MSKDKFYVSLLKKDGETIGHETSSTPPNPGQIESAPTRPSQDPVPAVAEKQPTFASVFEDFISAMESYRKFISLTLALASQLSSVIAEKRIVDFIKAKGNHRQDLCSNSRVVYELDMDCYREFSVHHDEAMTALEGANNLPEVMIIGLVSAYDAFLSQLLRVVLNKHEEIVLTSEKAIKFSELRQFASIEQARLSLIDREIESVLRESHYQQFSWMETKFSVPLREGLHSWSKFVELCERRNLLTHTGGVVTDQYLATCKLHGVDVSKIGVGTKLKVDSNYYSEAVGTIYEIWPAPGFVDTRLS